VSPSTGVTLQDTFNFICSGWNTLSANLPLSYAYQINDPVSQTVSQVLRRAQPSSTFGTVLPGGLPLTVTVIVSDVWGASTTTTVSVTVTTPDVSTPSALQGVADNALASLALAQQGGSLNQVGQFVGALTTVLTTAAAATGADSAAAVAQRTNIRTSMLNTLTAVVNTSAPVSSASALQTTSMLSNLVAAPAEVSGNMSLAASSLAANLLTSVLSSNPTKPLSPTLMGSALGVSSNLLAPSALGALSPTQAGSIYVYFLLICYIQFVYGLCLFMLFLRFNGVVHHQPREHPL
jgi:hypothetical protein